MDKEEKVTTFSNQNSRFGAGFIIGAVFAILLLFLISTKKGQEIVKKFLEGELDFEELKLFFQGEDGVKQNDFAKFSQSASNNQPIIKPEKLSRFYSHPSILGRRFFKVRK